ncbi:MAG: hypothetical protein JW973_03010 [Bacteroidales bacterium]|nr:hypothetical protein [Bacteroidales bacterium]
MKKFTKGQIIGGLFLLNSLVMNNIPVSGQVTQIELREGFYYINDQKFFIKGIGYEVGAYPGMLPWNRPFHEDILRNDLLRIADGGFNTIRTWNAFTDQELKVVQEFDLKIIMGIWIDPAGIFSDPLFLNASMQLVRDVLDYSKNYSNIIGYLIMNEPMPDHIFNVGFQHAYSLWMNIKKLIHELHPGIPVSFANTCVGDFIDPEIFDFTAQNIYPYNPSTVNYSYQYPAYVHFINHLRNDGHPLVVTEYGLSVSPSGEGSWGYGGNTLEEQTAGILYMYRSLIDGGASGSCVFNYSDGWWKAGDEFTHNDAAEEWFGLVNYDNLNDKYGTVRPVWDSLKIYNRAVIVSPKNHEIYGSKIPVEIFASDTLSALRVSINDEVKLDAVFKENYFQDTLELDLKSTEDMQLKFTFYNTIGQVMKHETIHLLASNVGIILPAISIEVSPQPIKGNHQITATYGLVNNGPLKCDSVLNFSFYTHIGWDYGSAGSAVLNQENTTYKATYHYTDNVDVITISAGLNAYYGSFFRRIVSEKIYIVGDTSYIELPSIIKMKTLNSSQNIVMPNPASEKITIIPSFDSPQQYYIFESGGCIAGHGVINGDSQIDIHSIPAGFYFIIFFDHHDHFTCFTFIKN